ncbi:MAG: hypothetical protein ACOC2L_04430, partial [Candidatus Sumerlaeota bacterium]
GNGYRFIKWDDGRMDNPRVDNNITTDLSVTALFEQYDYASHYRVVYHNRSADIEPLFKPTGIYIPAADAPGVLKIIPLSDDSERPPLGSVYVDGSLKHLMTRVDIDDIYVAGTLRNAVATEAYIQRVFAHDLGRVRMIGQARSSTSQGAEELLTDIYSGGEVGIVVNADDTISAIYASPAPGSIDPQLQTISVSLVGVSLRRFSAPLQAASLSLSLRKYMWRDESGLPSLDISLGRAMDLPDNVIEAGHLRTLRAFGGGAWYNADAPAVGSTRVDSLVRVQGRGSITRIMARSYTASLYDPTIGFFTEWYSGDIAPTSVSLQTDAALLQAMGGDIAFDTLRVAGQVPMLKAMGGEVNVGRVVAGTDTGYLNPHIQRIIGEEGVSGEFIAGIDASGQPDHRGKMLLIGVRDGYQIRGSAQVKDANFRLIGDTEAVSQRRFLVNP